MKTEVIDSKSTTHASVSRRDLIGAVGSLALVGMAAAPMGARAVTPAIGAEPGGGLPSFASLYPHESATRARRDLSGVWQFKLDPKDEGEALGWSMGIADSRPIPVPSSWNDLFDDARNYFGTAWYQSDFQIDAAWRGRRIHLRFGSANYRAKAWLNGQLLGEHVGGHLPFEFEITAAARPGTSNRLVVLVENKLREDRVPSASKPSAGFGVGGFPAVTFDFFPYAGLHRPVLLHSTPGTFIDDVTVKTSFEGAGTAADIGVVDVEFHVHGDWHGGAEVSIFGAAQPIVIRVPVTAGRARAQLHIPDVKAWGPEHPYLYDLNVRLGGATALDEYQLKIGVRTVAVKGDELLLNGRPIFLTGFGKHEDFFLHGRGLDIPVIVRDFELLKWIGANSFRTSHYPYSDEAMMLADQYGLLVIAETPGVSLGFNDTAETIAARQRQMTQALAELMARDKNHPCVALWSIANEPGISLVTNPDPNSAAALIQRGVEFFRPLFAQARQADPTRPVVLVSVSGGPDEWVGMGDIICTNLYYGWYSNGGQLETTAQAALIKEIERLRLKHNKPIMLTEFGADTIAGVHAQPAEMWSEEYEAEMLEMYIRVIRKHPYVVGSHPWAFADFRTSQGILRAASINNKGVFTRDRRPKLAAHTLRRLWNPSAEPAIVDPA